MASHQKGGSQPPHIAADHRSSCLYWGGGAERSHGRRLEARRLVNESCSERPTGPSPKGESLRSTVHRFSTGGTKNPSGQQGAAPKALRAAML